MTLQVDLDTDGELLLAVVKGTVSFDEYWQVLRQIYDAALEKHLNRILIDSLGAKGVLTTVDRYNLGVKFVAYCGEHKLWPWLAIVGQPPMTDGFGAVVARNRGLVTKTFSNRKEALEWLRAATK